MVLMKLRLNIPFQELAYRFQLSPPTVSRMFSSWLTVKDSRLSPLVYWPDRNQLWETMPMCFQQAFSKKVTVVIDCFEVLIDRPANLLARAQTFSSYKNLNTKKVLIGITPQGTISFISQAWGGRTSEKYLTENCGLLDKLMPGDRIMADRGFIIAESVGLKQAKLVIPAFTKGKTQLDPVNFDNLTIDNLTIFPKPWYCPSCQLLPQCKKLKKSPKKTLQNLDEALKCNSICICKAKPKVGEKLLKCHSTKCQNGNFFSFTMPPVQENAKQQQDYGGLE